MVNLALIIFVIAGANIRALKDGVVISFSLERSEAEMLEIPGGVWLNRAGEPELPSLLYKFGIPQNGAVEVNILKHDEAVIRGVEVRPVVEPGIRESVLRDTGIFYSPVYKQNRFFPDSLITVSRPAYLRDLYTVDVRINPVRYNPVKRELRYTKSLVVEIKFKGRPITRMPLDTTFERVMRHLVDNYEQCRFWRRIPERRGKNPFAEGVWFKIEVDKEGVYRIDEKALRDAGIDPAQFDPKTMRIYTAKFDLLTRGVPLPDSLDSLIEVPCYVQGEADGVFDKDDYLIFYGYPASHFTFDTSISWFYNGYATDNVYWFTFGGKYGKRMARVDAEYNGSPVDTLVNEVLHLEEDNGNPTRSGINWYWQDISPGEGSGAATSINIEHPEAQGNARITVSLFDSIGVSVPFIYRFSVNDRVFYEETLSLTSHWCFPPEYLTGETDLSGDSSTLRIELIRSEDTTGRMVVWFNGLDIIYQRRTRLNRPFHAFYSGSQTYSLMCDDADGPVFVFDITDMQSPKLFYNLKLENGRLYLSGSCDSLQLLYFCKLSSTERVKLVPAEPGRLRVHSSGCQYLIITHPKFSRAIMPLVQYRSNDYTVKIVDIYDIYDDFSYGKYDPLAIKHFLYYALNNWDVFPTFVLLVGDATYDYKNNLKKENPPNYIPMYETGSLLVGNPGIPPNTIYEGEYTDFGGGESIVLGRITVRTSAEVRDFIDKLITYETKNIDGLWNQRIILAGDDEYGKGWEGPNMHCGACEGVIQNIPDSLYNFAKIYMVSYPPFPPYGGATVNKVNAREDFIRELNRGGFAGVYFGHGNTFQLAHEGLFFDYNISGINNGRRYYFFYFGSCTVGRFDDSDYECIGEQFVRIKDGAIGTMAATGGTSVRGNAAIGKVLFNLITDPNSELTMGECFRIAKDYGSPTYLLIGDPATGLRKVRTKMSLNALSDSLKPLQKLKVIGSEHRYYLDAFIRDTTHIEKIDATTQDKISGHIYRLVQSGPNVWIPFDYQIDGKEIYLGFWDGDTAQLIIPQVPTVDRPVVKLTSFAGGKTGFVDSILVYGVASPSSDNEGPQLKLYDQARLLQDGDWVDKEFILTGKVSDESGINLLNSVEDINRGFYLYINNDIENKIDLRDYFSYDKNSFTNGTFNIDITLPKAVDTIKINVADNNFNQTYQELILNTETYESVKISDFLIYPNPLTKETGLWFTFNLSSSALVTLKVFTIAGRLVKTISDIYCHAGYNQQFWDCLDEFKEPIANGVYLVKAYCEKATSHDEVIEKFIVAR